jgi:hypothetical protein
MKPYIKYYLAENSTFGEPFDKVEVPSVEEWQYWYGLEPTKVNPNYDDFVKTYIERETHTREQSAKCKFRIMNVAITEEPDIKKIEERDGFVRWVGEPK